MKKIYVILIIILGFSSSALSQELISLLPLAPEGHFVNGREYIPLTSDKIRVELGYDGTSEDMLVLDLVVFNQTGRELSIDPGAFYYLSLDDPDALSSEFPPVKAVLPTQTYKWYDCALEKKGSEQSFSTVLGFAEAGVGIFSGLAAFFASENPAYIVDAVFSATGTVVHTMAIKNQIEEEFEQLSRERELIQQEMMRKGELAPGEVKNGFVCFPAQVEKEYLMFCIHIDDQEFQFVYKLLP